LEQQVGQQKLQLVLDFERENVVEPLGGSVLLVDVKPGCHEHPA
jgi:hypothetical protein